MLALHEPVHKIGAIAKAAGMKPDTIRNWFKRQGVTIDDEVDVDSAGERFARRLSGRTALKLAIMGRLSAAGVDVATAWSAAGHFANAADGERHPGYLFPNGETILFICGSKIMLKNVLNDADEARFRREISSDAYGAHHAVTVLELNEVVEAVCISLKLDCEPTKDQSDDA